LVRHGKPPPSAASAPAPPADAVAAPIANPDEIALDSDEDEEPPAPVANADEIKVDDSDEEMDAEESVDLVEAARKGKDPTAAHDIIGVQPTEVEDAVKQAEAKAGPYTTDTRFLALDKCGARKDFIQVGLWSVQWDAVMNADREVCLQVHGNPHPGQSVTSTTAIRS
jgi:hypothetical protein